jgi:hypothetical protein
MNLQHFDNADKDTVRFLRRACMPVAPSLERVPSTHALDAKPGRLKAT